MDFTSGGTDGPRLDAAALERIGLGDNVWGFLPGAADAPGAAEAFFRAGWRVRRSSRDGFQVECACAELTLAPGAPVSFGGFVDPGRVAELTAALERTGLAFDVECEDGPVTEAG
ncbi:hypothetical protein [Kitasatospora sp. NPDC057198]|uniref:hypothetical protein n=1 Tax=Kitasatospora sp. NPDC057198 TaxID=3346046 RepID=UPI003627F063